MYTVDRLIKEIIGVAIPIYLTTRYTKQGTMYRSVLSELFITVGCHPSLPVAMYAVDRLPKSINRVDPFLFTIVKGK
jgi:hypothetical protein